MKHVIVLITFKLLKLRNTEKSQHMKCFQFTRKWWGLWIAWK